MKNNYHKNFSENSSTVLYFYKSLYLLSSLIFASALYLLQYVVLAEVCEENMALQRSFEKGRGF